MKRNAGSIVVLLVLLVGLAAVAGCGSSASGSGTNSSSSGGGTVHAALTEFKIVLSKHVSQPGSYTFVADNRGKAEHALEVVGNGLTAKTKTLEPGQSTKLKVKLKPGTYTVYCPVDEHEMAGMKLTLHVK